ncbi:hypothetical protein V2B37_12965 [Natranaerobius thermophilus JW/NM-WN-LF]|uniref:Uncharacterized protein n=2 Tax=Natranaerobius TaxID=375928 RepID=B2A1B7_NATTJ|nr:hypothetical protein Nther_2492 [Natranaerobius thermophilus JW/NM-WN-LF]
MILRLKNVVFKNFMQERKSKPIKIITTAMLITMISLAFLIGCGPSEPEVGEDELIEKEVKEDEVADDTEKKDQESGEVEGEENDQENDKKETDKQESNNLTYENTDYDFRLEFPEKWEGRFEVAENYDDQDISKGEAEIVIYHSPDVGEDFQVEPDWMFRIIVFSSEEEYQEAKDSTEGAYPLPRLYPKNAEESAEQEQNDSEGQDDKGSNGEKVFAYRERTDVPDYGLTGKEQKEFQVELHDQFEQLRDVIYDQGGLEEIFKK